LIVVRGYHDGPVSARSIAAGTLGSAVVREFDGGKDRGHLLQRDRQRAFVGARRSRRCGVDRVGCPAAPLGVAPDAFDTKLTEKFEMRLELLDRYAVPNANFVLVVSPHSGPGRAERAKQI